MREYINEIWDKYDIDRNGAIEFPEAEKFLNSMSSLVNGGKAKLSNA